MIFQYFLSTRYFSCLLAAYLFPIITILPNCASAQDAKVIASDTVVGRQLDAPVNTLPEADKFWWSDDWYKNGIIEHADNFKVKETTLSYENPADGTQVPAILYVPQKPGKHPGILFQHGRRGLDELAQNLARRMAARGFVVLAPNVYEARFIERWPIDHDVATETDVDAAVDVLLAREEISTSKICTYSHTRGGYYTLAVAVKHKRQNAEIACYVSFYPHWQDPNAPEPLQVYRYSKMIDQLEIPTRIFIGEFEQYQRRRSIETAVGFMKQAKRDVRLIIYPGVGRGFDFRPPTVRTFADDLAAKDSNQRAARFMRIQLAKWNKLAQ